MIVSKYFLKTPPKNALPFQTSEGVKNFFEKRVSISSPPVGTSERINFFGVFLAEHRFWVCILTPFVQMSEGKFYFWFPKHPIIFPFPVRTSEGILSPYTFLQLNDRPIGIWPCDDTSRATPLRWGQAYKNGNRVKRRLHTHALRLWLKTMGGGESATNE